MYTHVTVIPADQTIIVDGLALVLPFAAPADLHAIQWHNGSGHIEYTDGSPNEPIKGKKKYVEHVAPYAALWKAEKARLQAHTPPTPTPEELAEQVRAERDYLLAATDKYLMPDFPISDGQRAEILAYRQTLRDVPEQPGFPASVIWPEKPRIVK